MGGYTGWIIVAVLLIGAALGYAGHAAHLRRVEQSKRRIPRKWPLLPRAMVNSREKLAWRWLRRAFPDHAVFVKVPVTRFTQPQNREEGAHWFSLLSGVYCTFTIADLDGHVIGCVDVPSSQGLSLSNQTLKHTLMTQCDVRYWVVDPEQLPSVQLLRAAFLGDKANGPESQPDHERTDAEFRQTRANLKAALSRQREHKPTQSEFAKIDALSAPPANSEGYESQLSTTWKNDSFMAPLDSRRSSLE